MLSCNSKSNFHVHHLPDDLDARPVSDKCRLQTGTPVSLNSALISLNNVSVSLNSPPISLNSVLVSLFTVTQYIPKKCCSLHLSDTASQQCLPTACPEYKNKTEKLDLLG